MLGTGIQGPRASARLRHEAVLQDSAIWASEGLGAGLLPSGSGPARRGNVRSFRRLGGKSIPARAQSPTGGPAMNERIVSAVFDSREEAERALNELRSAGVDQDSISIIGRHGEQNDSDSIDDDSGDGDDMNKSGAAKGAIGGAVGGALLGVAALAIPGVGPLAAAGAIASGAIPGAAAIGAGLGAGAGGLTGLLTNHGGS